ncbi:MAG: putative baseplate assembly protein [Candidatus Eremiobacteraeota bacterium]|nr:putative baseplate assembly protein [Candidatus Eremiobacteraeota bacterium]
MPLLVPNLDSRTYDDLVAEAKQRIPRYLPEWTDLNESDPGIALVELFAWMTEATLYQLNQAPNALRLKMLQLLGYSTRPAQPAKTQLQFTLSSGVDSIVVPSGTRVGASGATNADGSPVIFETDEAVVAIGPVLQAVLANKANSWVPFFADPSKPKPAFLEPFPLAVGTAETDALYLCFIYSSPFPKADVDLAIFLNDAPGDATNIERYTDTYSCDFGEHPVPPATWTWEYAADSTGTWNALQLLSDETSVLYRSGHVRFRFPSSPPSLQFPMPNSGDATVADYKTLTGYWVRARLTSATYEEAPQIVAITTNTAPASQALTVRNETLGGSAGTPAQTFKLVHAPVLPQSLKLTVDEGLAGGAQMWEQVADFYGCAQDARVYTIDASSGTVTFGDNHYGAIPLANATIQNNILATVYRYGGGAAGNVDTDKVTDIQSYVAYVDKVTNPTPAQGGADEEPIDDAVMRAAHEVRATNRAVTADDFEALALSTPGALIERAHALPLTNPEFLGIEVPGSVTVLVVPRRKVDLDPSLQDKNTLPPLPNRTTLEAVCAWLDAHRLVTTELHVAGPIFHTLEFSMTAYCSSDSDLASVANGVVTALRSLYAPVSANGAGWTWGATAYSAVTFAATMNVPGVTRVADFTTTLDGTPLPQFGDALIGPAELFWVPFDGVTITPRYDTPS